MIYRKFKGKKISAFAMGCMRLPVIDGDDNKPDEAHVEKMVAYAMENGVNYYDTAWGYHGGNSEVVLGKQLKKYPRDSFYLADKFPGYDLANMGKVEEIFEEQLKRCQVDYFDFYLFHNVCELNIEQYLDESYGTHKYLIEQKKNGRIKHLGMSLHGDLDVARRFLDKYGDDIEFCQIQLNYVDYKMQNAKGKLELLAKYNIPVWVMEPVRGGMLAKLPDEDLAKLKSARPDSPAVEWAYRFLQSIPQVAVTLSGSSSLDQMKENIALFSDENPLDGKEMSLLMEVSDDMINRSGVPCTACRYCTSHCPQELDIPKLLELYNEHVFTGGGFLAPMAIGAMPKGRKPWDCVGCRSCETVCPQQIKISEVLNDFSKKLKEDKQ